MARPRIDIVGLGPAGPELTQQSSVDLWRDADAPFVRTWRHPAAQAVRAVVAGATSFDALYEAADDFAGVYRAIADQLVAAATDGRRVVYAVPGSPLVAETTVELLRADERIEAIVHPAISFLDLAWERLAVDPVAAGVRLVDGAAFAVTAAGERGPMLVAQCWSQAVLSDVKLAVDDEPVAPVVILQRLGLADEAVTQVPWSEIDRSVVADHLTSLWIPALGAPVATELVRLDELVRTLRERCPWDRRQTHASLRRHLVEEAYEALDAIEALGPAAAAGPGTAPADLAAVDELEGELGDVLLQVCFHALLASEHGWFTLADVARHVHDKLVRRHPHVFGTASAATAEDVARRWEVAKRDDEGRSSIFDGIPHALPALALAEKVQRRAAAAGLPVPEPLDAPAADIGALLFAVVALARTADVDAEDALRRATNTFRSELAAAEADLVAPAGGTRGTRGPGGPASQRPPLPS